MDTKLKSSIKQEVILLVAWIFWGILFTVTYALFSIMQHLYESVYFKVKINVIVAAVVLVVFGIPLAICTIRYMMSVWQTERSRKIFLDYIPLEIALAATMFFGMEWIHSKLFRGIWYFMWMELYEGHRLFYYLVSGVLQNIKSLLVLLTVLGVSAWVLLRKIFYDDWKETSLIYRIYGRFRYLCRRYQICSSLGRKLVRKRGLFWLIVFIMFGAEIFMIMFISNWDYDMGVVSGGIALVMQILIIMYQRFFGVYSRDVTSLVEQIGAVSRTEPLGEQFQISPNSMFYEPFHQLEDLEETVKRSAEKQLQAERLKIDLITNVSHDLKTPLTSMVGYTDLLKQEELGPEAQDYVDIISQKQELLKEMIQNLFELSKSTSGVEELHMETLDMRKLLEQILGDMDDVIQESGIVVRCTFDDPPLLFSGDNEKMYRVVQNLLENALKYSLEQTRIYVDVKRTGEWLSLQMKNISKYEMDFKADEITGRFVRGDRSRSTQGHGLGLAIASSFTQNMGGTLAVEVDGDLFKVTVGFPVIQE